MHPTSRSGEVSVDVGSNSKQPKRLQSSRRKRLFACLAAILGIVFATAVSEIALRIYVATRGWTPNCYATGLVFFVPHDKAGYTLRPNLRLRSSTYDVAVNPMGFRGPEVSPKKPRGRKRIVVLGGSSVFGYLVGEGRDSCRLLEERLPALLRAANSTEAASSIGNDLEVINAGVPGYNLTQCRLRFETDIAVLQPDVVLLYLGWNDTPALISESQKLVDRTPPPPAWYARLLGHSALYGLVRYRLFPPDAPKFAPPPSAADSVTTAGAKQFREELAATVRSIQACGAIPIVCTQVMASNRSCVGLERFLGNTPEQVAANRGVGLWLTNCLRESAEAMHISLCDCAAEIPCNADTLGDAIHLTELGHGLVADRWGKHLVQVFVSGDME